MLLRMLYNFEGEINWSGHLVFSSSLFDGTMSEMETTYYAYAYYVYV